MHTALLGFGTGRVVMSTGPQNGVSLEPIGGPKKEWRRKPIVLGASLGVLLMIVTVIGIWRINDAQDEVDRLKEELVALVGVRGSGRAGLRADFDALQADMEALREEEVDLMADLEAIEAQTRSVELYFPIDLVDLKMVPASPGTMSLPMTLREGSDGCTTADCDEVDQTIELTGELRRVGLGIQIDLDFCGISLSLARTESGDFDGTTPLSQCHFLCNDQPMLSTVASMYLIPHSVDLVESGNSLEVVSYSGFFTRQTPADQCSAALISYAGLWTVGP